MNRRTGYAVILGIGMFLWPFRPDSRGDMCIGEFPSVRDAYLAADGVLIGTVVKVREFRHNYGDKSEEGSEKEIEVIGWNVYVRVDKAYKGKLKDEIVVREFKTGSLKSALFKIGSKYLLYVTFDEKSDTWRTDPCGRGSLLEQEWDDPVYLLIRTPLFPSSGSRSGTEGLSGTRIHHGTS